MVAGLNIEKIMSYEYEKNKLLNYIGDADVVACLRDAKCFIAGGALTSILSGREINDIDIYFRDYKSLDRVLRSLFNIGEDIDGNELLYPTSFSMIHANTTNKSIMFTKGEVNLQLIYFKFFNSPQEIFDTFDFTVNMVAYDFQNDSIVMDDRCIKDIAQRRLSVNTKTAYPIISLLRIEKYKERGYTISRKEFVNLCLAVGQLKLESWDDVADHIGGMYGTNYKEIFDQTQPFSVESAMSQLSKLDKDMVSNDNAHQLYYYELPDKMRTNLKIPLPPDARIFYKKVVRTSYPSVFHSYYRSDFVYPLNSTVNGGPEGIWSYKTIEGAKNHYTSSSGQHAIIKLEACESATIRRDGGNTFRLIGDVKVLEEIKQ